ncbi:SGNH hydrolase-type esterase domain-containing protein [Pyronema omphalodes]|nr:SGNH hydrolase-type esterase domain-containing protein [Pyronema omphalodes]
MKFSFFFFFLFPLLFHTDLTNALKIMPLGDSITNPGCWCAILYNLLTSSYPASQISFVGTQVSSGCDSFRGSYDGRNEGHAGWLATDIANDGHLVRWLQETRPEMVLMHLGTNDIWRGVSTERIIAAYGKMVDQMRASRRDIRILVAKIIPMNPGNCPSCYQRVIELNRAIGPWALGKATQESPITLVNQWSGFDAARETSDGVHPNAEGDRRMAVRWYGAVSASLR